VRICILSGDSLPTVQAIAKEAGLEGRGIDMSKHVSLDDLSSYSFFARVSPEQKEEIVTMFSKTGTVSMIGDGINDLLAMKAANASIAMGSGMAAARQAADIVLLDSDMNKLPDIIRQGRRSVHSVEKTSGLFLVKTMLSFGLCLLCIFWLKQYPFVPIQLTLVSSLGVGIPSLIFTLEPEEGKISGSYLKNVFSHAFPGAASALILVCLLSGQPNFSTLCTWMLAMNMELVLIKTARPLTPLRWAILILMPVLFCICALGFPAFFQLEPVSWKILFLFPILLVLQTALELEHLTKLRLVILVLSIALAVSLSGTVTWTAAVYRDQKLQEARHETLSQMVMEERQTMQTIEKVTADGREEDVLTALKEQAADDAYAKTIETAAELERIEEDQMDQIEALTHSDAVLQARSLLEHYDQIDDFLLEYYLADEDRYDFVMASLNPETEPVQTLDEDLSQVPLLLQWDARWGYLSYGDSTVYVAGCAPTSLSMVFSYLKQDPAITPIAIKTFSEENGYYVSGAGTAHSLLTAAAKQWDANVQTVSLDAQSVMDQLEQGRILVFNMVPGDFTRVGHFIVVSGMEGGKLIVRDPNSITRSDKLWDMDTVLSQTAAIWAYWQ
jgi:soluble P-type ATPase